MMVLTDGGAVGWSMSLCVYGKNSTFKLLCAPPCAGGDKLGLSWKVDSYLAAGKDPLICKM